MSCQIEDCALPVRARGYCRTHYMRIRRTGRPARATAEERFWSHVDKSEECWDWTGAKTANGYGRYTIYPEGKKIMAHRHAYQMLVGPIPDGLELDHTCYKQSCVNPSHLRPVTRKQNKENRSGAQQNSSSGVRGVMWNKNLGKWQAQVRHNKKAYYLGLFTDLAEAEAVVTAKRLELFTCNDSDRSD